MSRSRLLALAIPLLTVAAVTASDGPAPPKTHLAEPGKLVFRDDMTGLPGKEWKASKGKWAPADGGLRGSEVKAEMHAAVLRRDLPFRDVVIQYSFKLDGANATALGFNKAKGHLSRVNINKNGFSVRKHDSDKDGPDKPVEFEAKKVAIEPGAWHTLVVELVGKEMVATLDGTHVAYGGHDALDAEKVNFVLTVAGESATFKDLRVWEATPKKDWDAAKAKLVPARKK